MSIFNKKTTKNNFIIISFLLIDGSVGGTAMTTFTVNSSPSKGVCEISPNSGVELTTQFKLYCYEWKDEVYTLTYYKSYFSCFFTFAHFIRAFYKKEGHSSFFLCTQILKKWSLFIFTKPAFNSVFFFLFFLAILCFFLCI